MTATLALESGQTFTGELLTGGYGPIGGIVFDTTMTGITELITDPVYTGQALVLTNPLIGNCGVSFEDFQSERPQISALIVSEISKTASNFRSDSPFSAVLERHKLPAIAGVDTRSLVRLLRGLGSVRGCIVKPGESPSFGAPPPRYKAERRVCPAISQRARVNVPDTGVCKNLIEALNGLGVTVALYPYGEPGLFEDPADGYLLPDGPPSDYDLSVIRRIIDSRKPVLAVGLGHTLLASANGASLTELVPGHRGSNIPVRDLATGAVSITSQAHSAVVSGAPKEMISHVNVNDGTIEGLIWREDILSVQFRPDEAVLNAFIRKLR